jgi:aldehyde dehydrogenase (NAD+)
MPASFLIPMRRYFESGATLPYAFRKEQLQKLKLAIVDHEEDIYKALYKDLKKSPEEVWATETGLLLQEINYAIKHLRKWMQPKRVATNLLNLPSRSFIYPSPKGVTLIIGTWNFPLQLLLIPLVGAIAAGNCAIVKPSEHAPATAALIEKMLREIFSEEYIKVVHGNGAEVVPAMMNTFRFDHVFYTGSIPVGKSIYQLAAKDLVPVTLELGGKDPCIVEKDADLKVAARRIVVGKFSNAGQICVSPDYVLVHKDVKQKLINEIITNIKKFYGENPETNYNYGKIINANQFDRIVKYLSEGKIIYGGEYNKSELFISPALMENVPLSSGLMQEEIFGPVLPVFSFEASEEAFQLIQKNPAPLSFYLFTKDRGKQKEWIQHLRFGNGCINNTAWQFTNHHLPFGGIGNSGLGSYHGKQSFDEFTHFKSVMKTPTWFDPAVKYPPFKGKLKLFKWIIR